jgi:hypothetical protein
MHSNSATQLHGFLRPLPQPTVLTPAETKQVSGGQELSPNFGDGLKDQAAAWA